MKLPASPPMLYRRRLLAASLVLPMLLTTMIVALLSPQALAQAPVNLSYEVLEVQAHNSKMFTQGLLTQKKLTQTHDALPQSAILVETAGGYGHSRIQRYRADTGTLINEARFPNNVFAEGVAQVGSRLHVLTWREGISYVLDATTLKLQERHSFEGEGWGLTFDGQHLIMSDGSDTLTWRKPQDFSVISRLRVSSDGQPWANLNELEYARGMVWANVWQDNRVLAIDPETGRVRGVLDLAELVKENSTRPGHSVLNGIAYDETRDAFWVTGKLWPRRYLLKIDLPPNDATGLDEPVKP